MNSRHFNFFIAALVFTFVIANPNLANAKKKKQIQSQTPIHIDISGVGPTEPKAASIYPQLPKDISGISIGENIFLNIEEGDVQPIFSLPGFDTESCRAQAEKTATLNATIKDKSLTMTECQTIGTPPRNVHLTWLGTVEEMKMQNPFAPEEVEKVSFLDVKYDYRDPVTHKRMKGKGWIRSMHLNKQREAPTYATHADHRVLECSNSPVQSAKNICDAAEFEFNKHLNSVVEQLLPYVGRCPFENPHDLVKKVTPASQLIYDQNVIPMLKKIDYPKELRDGKKLSFDDFMAIDAYSRTNIGEMGRCFDKGLEYPFAEQGLILNRAKYVDQAIEKNLPNLATVFVRKVHASENTNVQVATEPVQISLWNNVAQYNNLNGVGQALCPPSNPDKLFWTNYNPRQPLKKGKDGKLIPNNGRKPSPEEYQIWKQSVKIAVEAALYPDHYQQKRIPDLNNLFHYTSGPATIPGLTRLTNKKANGKVLSDSKCINVWRDPTMAGALKKLSSE